MTKQDVLDEFDWFDLIDSGLRRIEKMLGDGWKVVDLLNDYDRLHTFQYRLGLLLRGHADEIIKQAKEGNVV